MARQRLQKVLAAAGVASRRECEQIILDGRVSVNGRPVLSLPALVDPAVDRITVDDRPLRAAERHIYLLLHKPRGVVCTNRDPDGRPRAVDLLVGVRERLYPVGRLDADSSGLLLMTNDGDLAERVAHPRYGVAKTYRAHVRGQFTTEKLDQLHQGVWLAEGKANVDDARIIHAARDGSVIEVTLREGRNREVRRILARLGYPVRRLIRICIGPLSLRGLPIGGYRPLTPDEMNALRRACTPGASADETAVPRRRPRRATPRSRPRPQASGPPSAGKPRSRGGSTRSTPRPARGPSRPGGATRRPARGGSRPGARRPRRGS